MEPQEQNHGALDPTQNVDRIRDIIFGSQMRDYDSRFQRLEERLAFEGAAMRSDLQKRLDALEAFMKGEVESMTNRLRAENTRTRPGARQTGAGPRRNGARP